MARHLAQAGQTPPDASRIAGMAANRAFASTGIAL
jgi:hypothetical protein